MPKSARPFSYPPHAPGGKLMKEHGLNSDLGGQAVRVLLVEDTQPILRAVRQGLEEEGFAVDVATDGEEADVKCRSTEYDVIVLDIMLPKIDGLTLLKRWRADGITTHVLMLTARGAVGDKVHGLDTGADDYLTKPV